MNLQTELDRFNDDGCPHTDPPSKRNEKAPRLLLDEAAGVGRWFLLSEWFRWLDAKEQ